MIKVQCDQYGNVKIDVEGMVGSSCKDATRQLENAFVGKRKDTEKPEYYETENTSVNQFEQLKM